LASRRHFLGPTAYAYQVERLRFDAILLMPGAQFALAGVEVREQPVKSRMHSLADLSLLVEHTGHAVLCRLTYKPGNVSPREVDEVCSQLAALAKTAAQAPHTLLDECPSHAA
jgi:hypothetical protein